MTKNNQSTNPSFEIILVIILLAIATFFGIAIGSTLQAASDEDRMTVLATKMCNQHNYGLSKWEYTKDSYTIECNNKETQIEDGYLILRNYK